MSGSSQVTSRIAGPRDIAAITALLHANKLPVADLAESRPELIVFEEGAALVGVGGVQRFGEVALVRSVAIAESRQGTGLGSKLITELERHASANGVRQLVLLTQTAETFFAARGYSRIERTGLPADVLATAEFRSLCPASASCMSKQLDGKSHQGIHQPASAFDR
jgi:amino-acid N-acetyltransferase